MRVRWRDRYRLLKDRIEALLIALTGSVAGCGVLPDIFVDAARSSATEAVEGAVGEAIDGLIDFDDFGLDGFGLPFLQADEEQ